ncbi:class I SAM-dependent methyltransferase [Paracidovorax sp. MALMAid1276]|uniref:class I SAM-dependent methyltransferase n=1 Tax=Paracidovorax sp. MALMAid1276 TaxID=3411631 RepID=UPI003B99A192
MASLPIICLPDLLQQPQALCQGFLDLVREPIRQGCGVELPSAHAVQSGYGLAAGFDLARFRALADVDSASAQHGAQSAACFHHLPAAALDELAQHWPTRGTVLSYEMPPWLRQVSEQRGTPFLDVRLSPLRFGSDLYVAMRSSDDTLSERIAARAVPPDEVRLEAATLAANVRMHRTQLEVAGRHVFQDLAGSLVLVGQAPGDTSLLTPDGQRLRWANFAEPLRALSAGRRVFFKSHPMATGMTALECAELARIIGQPVEPCHQSAYQLLSAPEDFELAGMSSALLQEAVWFGKKAHMLHAPAVPLAHESAPSAAAFHQLHFRTVLSPAFWHQVLAPERPAPSVAALPDLAHHHARTTLDRWGDYAKVATWERSITREAFERGGGSQLRQRLDTWHKKPQEIHTTRPVLPLRAGVASSIEPLRLHVGCASTRLEGYINIDCRATEATDHVCQAGDIQIAAPGTVTEIYSRHMLEHQDPQEARATLRHWHDLLAPGGVLHLIVPDVEFHARQILGLATSSFENQMDHAFASLWGWRDEARGGNREDAHRWGYTERSLSETLFAAGFTTVRRRTSGADSEPWHLNILAYKPSAAL